MVVLHCSRRQLEGDRGSRNSNTGREEAGAGRRAAGSVLGTSVTPVVAMSRRPPVRRMRPRHPRARRESCFEETRGPSVPARVLRGPDRIGRRCSSTEPTLRGDPEHRDAARGTPQEDRSGRGRSRCVAACGVSACWGSGRTRHLAFAPTPLAPAGGARSRRRARSPPAPCRGDGRRSGTRCARRAPAGARAPRACARSARASSPSR